MTLDEYLEDCDERFKYVHHLSDVAQIVWNDALENIVVPLEVLESNTKDESYNAGYEKAIADVRKVLEQLNITVK